MAFSLERFDLPEMLRCGLDLRRVTKECATMADAARSIVCYFHDECVDDGGARQCALVRFYKTHAYGALDGDLRAFADGLMGGRAAWDTMRCLVLLASAGDEPEWNDPRRSRGHRAIPLPSVQIVEQAPMIAQLVREMGMDLEHVVSPEPELIRGMEGKTYNVFHVAEAKGSPFIPAQDFVERHGIRSVVGCGGIHMTGDLYSVILFSRAPIPPESADRFRNVALDLKLAISRFRDDDVFAHAE